jgi:hypothetical protein
MRYTVLANFCTVQIEVKEPSLMVIEPKSHTQLLVGIVSGEPKSASPGVKQRSAFFEQLPLYFRTEGLHMRANHTIRHSEKIAMHYWALSQIKHRPSHLFHTDKHSSNHR